MAALTSKASKFPKLKIMCAFTAITSFFLLYFMFTLAILWNNCKDIQVQAKSSSSSMLFTQLHNYFLHIFNLTHSQSDQMQIIKWNHHNIGELCNQNVITIAVFVITSQFRHDANLIIYGSFDWLMCICHKILHFFQTVAIQQNPAVMLVYFCVLLILFIISCGAIFYYKKVRHLKLMSASLTPYYDKNSSPSLERSRSPITCNESRFQNSSNHLSEKSQISISALCSSIFRWLLTLAVFSIFLSIPWEFIRLYQKAVAHRAASVNMGLPAECNPNALSWTDTVKSLLRWHLSWSHDHNPCIDYYHATLVDPLWEVSPLMVLSSVLSRGVVHPLEVVSSSLGRSVRIFFSEIPAHWQPAIMLVSLIMLLALLLVLCSYRVSIPLLLRIEPKTPLSSPADTKSRARESRSTTKSRTIKSRQTANQDNSKKLMKSNGIYTRDSLL